MTALWLALFSVLALGGGFYMADQMMGSDDPIAAGVPEIFAALDDFKDAAANVDNQLAERFGAAAEEMGDFFESFPGSLGIDSDQPESDDPPVPASTNDDPPLPGEQRPSTPVDPSPVTEPSGEDPDKDRGRVEVCNLKSGNGTSITVSGSGANSHLNQGNTLGVCEE